MKTLANKPDIQQNYQSDFDNIYPYSKIKRCLCNKNTGEIAVGLSDETSLKNLSGSPVNLSDDAYDVMVRIPAFYYKVEFTGDHTNYSILQDVPDGSRYLGDHEIHPAFVRADGSIRPYVLVGAFKGFVSGNQLRSQINKAPTVNQTISWFRDRARQGRNQQFNINTVQIVSAIQMLYIVEFSNLNSQAMIGSGWTNKSAAATTGSTAELGNRSGYLGVNGNQISYRGIEDFWGNIWEFVDGLIIRDDGFYITNNPQYFGNYNYSTKIAVKPITDTDDTKNNYVKSMFRERAIDYCFFPSDTVGGSENTYWCDYHWAHDKGEDNIAIFGSAWVYGSRAGAFCWSWHDVASDAWSYVGARLVFLP